MPASFATYAGKKSASTLLYETTSLARLGCGVAVPGAPATGLPTGVGVPAAHEARMRAAANALASLRDMPNAPR